MRYRMLIQVPPEIDPYIKMHYYNILIPKLGLPDNLKRQFDEFNYKQYIAIRRNYNDSVNPIDFSFRERLHGRQFSFLDTEKLKDLTFSENGIDFKKEENTETQICYRLTYEMFIKYYKSKGYYLLFSPNQKLSLWQHLLMLLDLKRCYYFFGYN